ncbi:MAG: transglutaminase-like cysteine peptidase [Rhizobiales bacterium]|nr:transglutaminase-like cysteine peptidase [Hyphomicrobiales bacterium]MBO6697823.1 transglutaminase-like cysteine peptidase [Hyphomicrobiales bacterium]MBO6735922.1 transglutaminase-like cysteine peptidase [Hyphomicrobiales bacterium]MBO6912392.1 transglutaminase-like cysteine peptidase [Hyphomicrobiales bacterium]MBO6955022.1 transglutaminase-like cysteine peptidase [Hyphomicrobiales bacterium]
MRNKVLGIIAGTLFAGQMGVAHAELPYMEVLGATSAPIGYVQLCQRTPSICVQRTASPSVVQLSETSWRDLLAVNTHVNQAIQPVTDAELYGHPEVWTMPTTYGDCEDYVLMKRQMLIDNGWPASALLITVVRERSGEGHAVLTVRTDRGDFILDNQEANVLRWDETNYHYIKRQSEFDETVWASINDGRV